MNNEANLNTGPRILIVEDDDSISDFLSTALTNEGYTVTTAPNGWIGLTLTASFQPDLILLDFGLPIINGQDFFAVQQGLPHSVPIIGISAMRNAKSIAETLGLADFLEKPFDLDDLCDRIKAQLSNLPNPD
jgi:DNA-binding response OmpR family regulator